MSKFCSSNVENARIASMQSWRISHDTPDAEKWPTSRWFQRYHTNYKTEQWLSREIQRERETIRRNKHLEKASSSEVWKVIKKEKASTNQLDKEISLKQQLIKSPNNGNRACRIASSHDVMHRIHELKMDSNERNESNWRLKV